MSVIMFKVRQGLSDDEHRTLLQKIEALPGVEAAKPLREGAKNASLRRLHFARLKDDASTDDSLAALRDLPEIEQADVPAQRGLAD